MLPRVSAALSKFIAPIISHQRDREQPRHPEQGFQRQSAKNLQKAELSVVPPLEEAKPAEQLATPAPQPQPAPKLGVAEAFIELFRMLRGQRIPLSRRTGAAAYASPKGLKRARLSRGRKGVLLDRKVE